jgi:hypothetical protein
MSRPPDAVYRYWLAQSRGMGRSSMSNARSETVPVAKGLVAGMVELPCPQYPPVLVDQTSEAAYVNPGRYSRDGLAANAETYSRHDEKGGK